LESKNKFHIWVGTITSIVALIIAIISFNQSIQIDGLADLYKESKTQSKKLIDIVNENKLQTAEVISLVDLQSETLQELLKQSNDNQIIISNQLKQTKELINLNTKQTEEFINSVRQTSLLAETNEASRILAQNLEQTFDFVSQDYIPSFQNVWEAYFDFVNEIRCQNCKETQKGNILLEVLREFHIKLKILKSHREIVNNDEFSNEVIKQELLYSNFSDKVQKWMLREEEHEFYKNINKWQSYNSALLSELSKQIRINRIKVTRDNKRR